jgi:hypothetical protein
MSQLGRIPPLPPAESPIGHRKAPAGNGVGTAGDSFDDSFALALGMAARPDSKMEPRQEPAPGTGDSPSPLDKSVEPAGEEPARNESVANPTRWDSAESRPRPDVRSAPAMPAPRAGSVLSSVIEQLQAMAAVKSDPLGAEAGPAPDGRTNVKGVDPVALAAAAETADGAAITGRKATVASDVIAPQGSIESAGTRSTDAESFRVVSELRGSVVSPGESRGVGERIDGLAAGRVESPEQVRVVEAGSVPQARGGSGGESPSGDTGGGRDRPADRPGARTDQPNEGAGHAASEGSARDGTAASAASTSTSPLAATSETAGGANPLDKAMGPSGGQAGRALSEALARESAPASAAKEGGGASSNANRVTLDFMGENGIEGRLRVALRGNAVRATIISPDRAAALRIGEGVGELERALIARGFSQSHVSVQHGKAAETGSAASKEREDPRSQENGRGRQDTTRKDGGGQSRNDGDHPSERGKGKRMIR